VARPALQSQPESARGAVAPTASQGLKKVVHRWGSQPTKRRSPSDTTGCVDAARLTSVETWHSSSQASAVFRARVVRSS